LWIREEEEGQMNIIFDQKELEQQYHPLKPWSQEAFKAFRDKMTDRVHPFPCIPAAMGFHFNHLRYAFIEEIEKVSSVSILASTLKTYGAISKSCGAYTSLIVFIKSSCTYTIEEYEQLFWKVLAAVCELDENPGHLIQNPHHPAWEFCFHHEPYFVYCATPAHQKRKSRSFPYMMLAITPRWVLKHFHETYANTDLMKSRIRKRLGDYDDVPVHPELKWYGGEDNYEWKQYFLRDDETTLPACPFANLLNKKQL
jgi:FPC/CPF motif-containing protein YcgG